MSESSIIPRAKTDTRAIYYPNSRCGNNWWMDIRIRCPYKDTDIAYRTLPSLGDIEQIETLDHDLMDEAIIDHERIKTFISQHSSELNSVQKSNIEKFLKWANDYISSAQKIWNFWQEGFKTANNTEIESWPLNVSYKSGVTANIEEGHRRDADTWKRLMGAALKNIRCAEEVAKRATIFCRNKDWRTRGRRYGINPIPAEPVPPLEPIPAAPVPKFEPIPAAPIPKYEPIPAAPTSPKAPPLGAESEAEQEPISESIETEDPKVKVSKKRDNTLLIAGAAMVGILALSKK